MTTKVGRMTRAAVLCLLMAAAMPLTVAGQAPTPPAAVDEFVPLDQLPPEDEIPAAPLVVAAYSAIWVLFMGYVWRLSRRLTQVQREIDQLRRQTSGPPTAGPPA